MIIPQYINENKSDIRAIKPGWYAIDDGGNLYSGPFPSRAECVSAGTQPADGPVPPPFRPRPK